MPSDEIKVQSRMSKVQSQTDIIGLFQSTWKVDIRRWRLVPRCFVGLLSWFSVVGAIIQALFGTNSISSQISGELTMYRPNFCCECGEKVIRLRWRIWHSRSFCSDCARSQRRERFGRPIIASFALLSLGLIAGSAGRPAPPPLIIQRSANSPLLNPAGEAQVEEATRKNAVIQEEAFICGARTKKGTPCSRRVHEPGRCWQHKGMPSMIRVVPIK